MAFTITLTDSTSVLKANFFPPIELNTDYEIGLVSFSTWNSVPNVTEKNNKFYYGDDKKIEIPVGSYEIEDIQNYLAEKLTDEFLSMTEKEKLILNNQPIQLYGDKTLLKSVLTCKYPVNFVKPNNIGSILGFKDVILEPLKKHISNDLVSIIQTEYLAISCNLVKNSYKNGDLNRILHTSMLTVPPGYKIVEFPSSIIYLPVVDRTISNIEVTICDQNNNLVDLRGENSSIQLHLRPIQNAYNIQ